MGFKSLVQNLVSEHGALLDAMTLSKQTSLHLAAESGQYDVVKVLLDMKADIDAMDNVSNLFLLKILGIKSVKKISL